MSAAYLPPVQTDCVVDLSHAQDIPDPVAAFTAAKASGVALIIHKVTQGTLFVDQTFAARRAAAAQVGLLFGAYHFCDGSDPVAQMKHFMAFIGDPTGIALALDAEKNASQVSVVQVAMMVQNLPRLPLIYMGAGGPDGNGMQPNAVLSQCDLWLPEYGSNPICPPGFSKWVLHQYTGDGINGSGYVAGIGSGLDRSYFAGTVDELKAWHAAMCAGIPPSQVIVVQPPPPTQPGAPLTPPKPSVPPVMSGDVPTARGRMVACVKALQAELAAQGFNPGPADGDPGPNTIRALQAWR